MRLRFSRTADYGLRAALEVARAPEGQLVTRHEIAAATGAPASVIAQPLAALVRAGLLSAHAGPRGGYALARLPRDLSIRDIVLAIEGEPQTERCVLHETACSSTDPCPFHLHLAAAQRRFLETLRDTSLADILAGTPPATP